MGHVCLRSYGGTLTQAAGLPATLSHPEVTVLHLWDPEV